MPEISRADGCVSILAKEMAVEGLPTQTLRRKPLDATELFEPLIGTAEAAQLLHIHPKTLQRKARLRTIPGHQIGKQWLFRASELDAWLKNAVSSQCHSCR
jgi:excisionase family DNA binding protein